MLPLSNFLRPVRFGGADAAAYREWAINRDNVALRLFTLFLALSLFARLIMEWKLFPDTVGAGLPYRAGGIACLLVLFAASFHQGIRRFFHGAVGAGIFLGAVSSAWANALVSSLFPYALAGGWSVVFLLGLFSFNARLVILMIFLAVALPSAVIPISGVKHDLLSTAIPLGASSVALGLALSYALEQHRRRGFQRDLDLAASHAELRRTHQELAGAYATLKETQAQLIKAEKTAALGRVVANVAHRINTPIGNVVAVASHMDESLRRLSDMIVKGDIRRSDLTTFVEETAEGNGIVLANAQRTADLIDMFKCLVADAGERPGRMDVGAFLDVARPSLEAMMTPGVALVVDVPPGLEIMAQSQAMEMVARELVRNAVTHAFPGGRTGTVTIRARGATGDGVELQVIDDGQGIPSEHLEHVFDPFYTDGNIGGGHGLGLSIVHNAVVGPLSGAIAIESREGQGTDVTIRLPAAKTDEAKSAGGVRESVGLRIS